MGLLSKTTVQALTDKVVAEATAQLTAVDTSRTAWAVGSLYNLVDALGDPDLEIALGAAANRIDETLDQSNWMYHQYLPGGSSALATDTIPPSVDMVANDARKALYTAIKSYVTSSIGGKATSVDAYLTAVGARIHPVFAEIARRCENTAFKTSGVSANVFAPRYSSIAPTGCFIGTAGSWTNKTAAAISPTGTDITGWAAQNDFVVIGFDRPFQAIALQFPTPASTDIAAEFYYSSGGVSYTKITSGLTDNTVGATLSDYIIWTPPSDWARTNLDTGGNYYDAADLYPRYYLAIKRTGATLVTPPTIAWVRGIPTVCYRDTTGFSGLVTQPPLALVRITSAAGGTVTVTLPKACPPGSSTWSSIISDYASFDFLKALKFEVLCITGGGNSNTITISYKNQAGASSTQAQTLWNMSGAAVGDIWPTAATYLTLKSPDTGVEKFLSTDWAATANTTRVVLAVTHVLERTPTL